jgi:hypothetical protein
MKEVMSKTICLRVLQFIKGNKVESAALVQAMKCVRTDLVHWLLHSRHKLLSPLSRCHIIVTIMMWWHDCSWCLIILSIFFRKSKCFRFYFNNLGSFWDPMYWSWPVQLDSYDIIFNRYFSRTVFLKLLTRVMDLILYFQESCNSY